MSAAEGGEASAGARRPKRRELVLSPEELRRLAIEAARRAAFVGLAGAVILWLLALVSRTMLVFVAAYAGIWRPVFEGLARVWYWGSGFAAASFLMLTPLAVWGMVGRGRPQGPWQNLLQMFLASATVTALFRGELWLAGPLAASLVWVPLIRSWLPAGAPTGTDFGCLIQVVGQVLIALPILAFGMFHTEPAWLARTVANAPPVLLGPGSKPLALTLFASATAWIGVALVARGLYHCARAGRLDPPRSWMFPSFLLLVSAAASQGSYAEWAARVALSAAACWPLVWWGARQWPTPRVDAFGLLTGVSALNPVLFGAMCCALVFVDPLGITLSSMCVGGLTALGVGWTQKFHLQPGGPVELRGGVLAARDGALLRAPAALCRETRYTVTGRALKRADDGVMALLVHRERHPVLPASRTALLLPLSEAGALAPLLLALTGARSEIDVAATGDEMCALLWLADPGRLVADLEQAPAVVLDRLGRLEQEDPSEIRRLTWSWLRSRARAHLGSIDEMVREIFDLAAFKSKEDADEAKRHPPLPQRMGRGRWMDVIEAQGGFIPEIPGREGLLSANVQIEWAEALRGELDRVIGLALSTRDPAALHVLEEHRQALDESFAPLEGGASEALLLQRDHRDVVENLLRRAWSRRWALSEEPVEDLLEDLLVVFWHGGWVPLLARARGRPALAELLAGAWDEGLRTALKPADWFWENESWTDSISRRLSEALEGLGPTVRAADWHRALLARPEATPALDAVAGFLDDDLRPGAGVGPWMLGLSGGDPRALLMPLAYRRVQTLDPERRGLANEALTRWLPKPWKAQPGLALLLWEAAETAVSSLPGGQEEARRLREQRVWLAERLGGADDLAQAAGLDLGSGLVARRSRAEQAEAALLGCFRRYEKGHASVGELLTAFQRVGGSDQLLTELPVLPADDALVIQALAGHELLTLRLDARGLRVGSRQMSAGDLLDRLDLWRSALREGYDDLEEATTMATLMTPSALESVPGVLHYVGLGALCRLPLGALVLEGTELGRRQAWIRYDRPSRVSRVEVEPWARWKDGFALWWSPPDSASALPQAEPECRSLRGFQAGVATFQSVLDALSRPCPLHLACHAKGGRVDDSDASLGCGEKELHISDLERAEVRSSIVYLSSCDAALGSLVSGQHPMGITGALLRRGVGHVISTQWSIYDQSAAEVAQRFWHFMRRGGRAPPHALRDAVCHYARPASHWAVIEVHGGEPGARSFPPAA